MGCLAVWFWKILQFDDYIPWEDTVSILAPFYTPSAWSGVQHTLEMTKTSRMQCLLSSSMTTHVLLSISTCLVPAAGLTSFPQSLFSVCLCSAWLPACLPPWEHLAALPAPGLTFQEREEAGLVPWPGAGGSPSLNGMKRP